MLRFAGLDASPPLVARIADETRIERYADTGPDEHRRRGEVGEWRATFDEDDTRLFEDLAGGLSESVGYSLGAGGPGR